jgi:hypothetical protein
MIKRITDNSLSLSAMVKRSVMATLASVLSGMGIWLVVCLVSPCIARSDTLEGGTDINAGGMPRITATPQRVKVSEDSASTDIAGNTGNGSNGFVFVTANGRPPVLITKGNEGSRVISWIRRGNYVFDLYGDAQRRPLHEPKGIAFHRASKRCWFWAIRGWWRDSLPRLPTSSALSMDSSL